MRRAKLSSLAVLFAAPVLAQTDATYLLLSSDTVTPTTPTTTIKVWATWTDPGALFVFGGADYDLTAGDGVFSNPVNVLNGFGSLTGVIAVNVISGALNGQFHIPQFGVFGSRDNPILLATYDWTTTDFTPRTVSLDTSNTNSFFLVRWDPPLPFPPGPIQMALGEFTPGFGAINVIPAPAAWLVLALPLAAASRRRRS